MVDFSIPVSEKLNSWNQSACRKYISACLCFPHDSLVPRAEVIQHLQGAISRLEVKQPILASEVRLDKYFESVYLVHEPPDSIHSATSQVTVEERPVDDLGSDFPRSYQEIRDLQWAQGLFINKHHAFEWDNLHISGSARVLRLQVTFLEEGLLIWIHLHHTVADGTCLGSVIDALAAETRGVSGSPNPPMTPLQPTTLTKSIAPDISWQDLLNSCSEYGLFGDDKPWNAGMPLPRPDRLSTHEPRTAAIFVFKISVLKNIGNMIGLLGKKDNPPSTFVVLAALTWAYATRARYRHEIHPGLFTPQVASLALAVNWRGRAFRDDVKGYFGNASAAPIVRVPRDFLLGRNGTAEDPVRATTWLPVVAAAITEAIEGVDEPFVATRTALLDRAAKDGWAVGHAIFPGCASDFGMNSWRYFGGDAEWQIPGVGVSKADRVRMVAPGSGCGGALILPAKREAEELEVLVSLTEGSMRELRACQEWMKVVDRVVLG
ncbi:hypothetical protein ACHAQA_006459 [Verticillium albo-atrum]